MLRRPQLAVIATLLLAGAVLRPVVGLAPEPIAVAPSRISSLPVSESDRAAPAAWATRSTASSAARTSALISSI